MTATRALITGIVQGVGFRAWTYRTATRLELKGYVRNLPDGRVEVFLQGDDAALKNMLLLLGEGPRGAVVERVETEEQKDAEDLLDFEIR